MTNEQKNLLLVDISARLSYGVKYRFTDKDSPDFELSDLSSIMKYWIEEGKVLPYLRSVSSMTTLETLELNLVISSSKVTGEYFRVTDFYNEHHIDYRGLIPMGLAILAPEDMYEISK